MVRPNGIAFSLDERLLYVADTGATHQPGHPAEIRVYDVNGDTVTNGRQFCVSTAGLFDGFRLDADGRIWTSAADGVHCYDPDGTLIGKIKVPEPVANVAAELLPSTVQIIAAFGGDESGATGSGFVLDRQGHVVTNSHVVADAT